MDGTQTERVLIGRGLVGRRIGHTVGGRRGFAVDGRGEGARSRKPGRPQRRIEDIGHIHAVVVVGVVWIERRNQGRESVRVEVRDKHMEVA